MQNRGCASLHVLTTVYLSTSARGATHLMRCTIREPQTDSLQRCSRGPQTRSTELARNIVVQRDTHQDDEQGDTHLLSQRLGPLRKRAALEPLHQLEQD